MSRKLGQHWEHILAVPTAYFCAARTLSEMKPVSHQCMTIVSPMSCPRNFLLQPDCSKFVELRLLGKGGLQETNAGFGHIGLTMTASYISRRADRTRNTWFLREVNFLIFLVK